MSLNLRIILSATLLLVVFITLTAAALDRAFFESTESALRDKLTSQLYALMAAAEVDNETVIMPSSELNALLGLPSSGVYAHISDQAGRVLWQSSSVLGATLPPPKTLNTGEKRFSKTRIAENDFYSFAYGVDWATETSTLALNFNITTDLLSFNKQINQYRTTVWGWLSAMAVLLLISQAAILRWGLTPLRRVGAELTNIETGKQQQIEQSYPREIEHLTRNINLLLQQERDQKTRYRNALGDLAHSLKTPLAVLQTGLKHNNSEQQDDSMQQQITRMNTIVEYQLQRAATAGSASIGKSIDLGVVINRLLDSLNKVYHDKTIKLDINIEHGLMFKGDEGDMMELLGNLLDNAFKWAERNIRVIARQQCGKLYFSVADDGPGIKPDQLENILKRGVRADQNTAGHGIGLSIVRNIVDAYQGELIMEKNQWQGVEVRVIL